MIQMIITLGNIQVSLCVFKAKLLIKLILCYTPSGGLNVNERLICQKKKTLSSHVKCSRVLSQKN